MTGYDRKALNIAAWDADRAADEGAARVRLDQITDPVVRAVLDLHAPFDGDIGFDECHGCSTVRVVAEAIGSPFPPAIGWADDPDFDPHAPIPGYPTTEGA